MVRKKPLTNWETGFHQTQTTPNITTPTAKFLKDFFQTNMGRNGGNMKDQARSSGGGLFGAKTVTLEEGNESPGSLHDFSTAKRSRNFSTRKLRGYLPSEKRMSSSPVVRKFNIGTEK